jgi:hypothetical protein
MDVQRPPYYAFVLCILYKEDTTIRHATQCRHENGCSVDAERQPWLASDTTRLLTVAVRRSQGEVHTMRHTSTVIIGTGVSGVIVLVAGIGLGWFGFPALIVNEIKHVSNCFRTIHIIRHENNLPSYLSLYLYHNATAITN